MNERKYMSLWRLKKTKTNKQKTQNNAHSGAPPRGHKSSPEQAKTYLHNYAADKTTPPESQGRSR